MKGLIIVSLILLAGIASAFTPEQQTTLNGLNLSYNLGMAYEEALLGQDIAGYNALVDEYNAWIQQNFGANSGLEKSKILPSLQGGYQELKTPFNASSELGKFGNAERKVVASRYGLVSEEDSLAQKAANF